MESALADVAANRVSRRTSMPLYLQVQAALRDQIEAGVRRPGERIPSEPQLASQFRVSRITIRQALALLEDDRMIVRIKGRGTFVARPKITHHCAGISRLVLKDEGHILTELLNIVEMPVGRGVIQAQLGVLPGTPLVKVAAILSVAGTGFAISDSFFRQDDGGWLTSLPQGRRVLNYEEAKPWRDICFEQSATVVETANWAPHDASHLDPPSRSPALLAVCTEYVRRLDGSIAPFEVCRITYRSDMVRLVAQEPSTLGSEMFRDNGGALWAAASDVLSPPTNPSAI